eukprot:13863087-Alexandrium_andersonii.AAC.1
MGQTAPSAAPNRRQSGTPSAAPPVPGSTARVSPTFAGSEPRRGTFGPLGALGPPPPRAGFWAPARSSDL